MSPRIFGWMTPSIVRHWWGNSEWQVREEVGWTPAEFEILVPLEVSSRVPMHMPLQVQINETHRTQQGFNLILCFLNCMGEDKARNTVVWHLSWGGSVANHVHSFFCPINDIWVCSSQGMCGSPQHGEVEPGFPKDLLYPSSHACPRRANQFTATQPRCSPLLRRGLA